MYARQPDMSTNDARMLQVEMEVLLQGEAAGLVSLLQREQLSVTALKQLDQLTTRNLRSGTSSRVLLVFRSLEILSRRQADLETLISRGLTAKLLGWFEVLRDLLTSDLRRRSTPLLNIAEAFFDYFLLLAGGPLPVSQLSVLLAQLTQFCRDQELHFPLRLEAIRTINSILEALDKNHRHSLRSGRSHDHTLCEMATAVLTAGDYELQASLSEALCRLTPRKERRLRANQWFPCRDISDAFCDIRDKDFELGDQVEQFWVDFNLGSGSVSFFIDEPKGSLWASVNLAREEVTHYSVRHRQNGFRGPEVVLGVQLKTPIMHQGSRGQRVELTFDLERQAAVEEAAGRVFTLTRRRSSPRRATASSINRPLRQRVKVYRKKRKSRNTSKLKVLPLSSPSSDDGCSVIKEVRTQDWRRATLENSGPLAKFPTIQFKQVPTSRIQFRGGSERPGAPANQRRQSSGGRR
ncbi:synaptonemal complex protein 2-like isoform X4 [Nelusetta ayraudi]|uniref:synaptonemal complex protein 2-like isoform X4 n=1 Tax=Nelusetta ayraudi TaxID=303726 RepID=UPI003F6FCE57